MTKEEREKEYKFGYLHGMIFGVILAFAISFIWKIETENLLMHLLYIVAIGLGAGLIARAILNPWKKRHDRQVEQAV